MSNTISVLDNRRVLPVPSITHRGRRVRRLLQYVPQFSVYSDIAGYPCTVHQLLDLFVRRTCRPADLLSKVAYGAIRLTAPSLSSQDDS
jgi:hypothetical protein